MNAAVSSETAVHTRLHDVKSQKMVLFMGFMSSARTALGTFLTTLSLLCDAMQRIPKKEEKKLLVFYTLSIVFVSQKKVSKSRSVFVFRWKIRRWILNWRTSRKQLDSTHSLFQPENRPSSRNSVV